MKINRILIVLILVIFSGCTAQLRQDVDRLEKSLNDLRSFQAEQTTQISELQSVVRSLGGKIEELDYSQNKKMGSEVDSLKNALSDIKRRVPPPSIVPVNALEDDEASISGLPEDVGSRFSESLGMIREGRFQDAVPLLQTALDASNGAPYSSNLLFWLGLCYEGSNDNRQALLAYNEVVQKYGKTERAPLALYKQSVVMGKIGDQKGSIAILKKLIVDYPSSSEAATARMKLKNN